MPAAELYRALWRYRIMIVLLTVLAAVVAYAFTRTQPTIYEATALVRIQQRASSPEETFGSVSSLELGQRLAQTYARIVETHSIEQRVANALSGRVPRDDISISASPVGDVELLEISARSERPRNAALVANATTAALGDFITETGTLRDQTVVVDSARAPTQPILPRTLFTVAVAILLALLFNAGLALAREFFADRLPEVDEFQARFGYPVLATVPSLSLKPYSAALKSLSGLAEGPLAGVSTQSVRGPTRWSVEAQKAQGREQ